jgi:hypothetical protein
LFACAPHKPDPWAAVQEPVVSAGIRKRERQVRRNQMQALGSMCTLSVQNKLVRTLGSCAG